MVAQPTTSPDLSDRETHLLAAFISLNFSIFKLAEQERLLPKELIAFTESPAIQSHIASLKQFVEDAFNLRAAKARESALDHLEQLAGATENPVEKRRAASTIFRGLSTHNHAAKVGRSTPAERPIQMERVIQVGRASGPPSNHPNQTLQPPPRPHITPASSHSAQELLGHIANAIENSTDPDHQATLKVLLATDARINGEHLRNLPNQLAPIVPTRPVKRVKFESPFYQHGIVELHAETVVFIHDEGSTKIRISLSRRIAGPQANCWVLRSLDRDEVPNTS